MKREVLKLEPDRRLVQDEPSIVDIDGMLRALWRGKWIVLATTFICAAASIFLALSLPNQYSATSQLLVTPDGGQFIGIRALDTDRPPSEFLVESKSHMVRSNRVLERVVAKLSLVENDEFTGLETGENGADDDVGRVTFLDRITALVEGGDRDAASGLRLNDAERLERLAMKALNEVLTVRPAGNSYTIMVEATTENPVLSADIANAIATEFVELEKESKIAEAQEANAWILERLDQMQERVDRSSRALEDFRIRTGDVTEMQVTDLARFLERLRSSAPTSENVSQMELVEVQLREKSMQIIELQELERQAQADRSLYERLLERARELQELETLQVADTRVIADALPPLEKAGPPRKMVAILGVILGLALGVGLLAMRNVFLAGKGARPA